MRPPALAVLAVLLATTCLFGQGDLESRVQKLEEELRAARAQSDTQAERIRDLELTILSLQAEQDRTAAEAVHAQDLETAVDTALRTLQATTGRKSEDEGRLDIRGQGRFVWRIFGGEDISTDQSFEIEHLLITADVALGDDVRLFLTPAVSHSGSIAIIEAAIEYQVAPWLAVTGGRFLIPFNGVHAWAYPSDSFIEPYLVPNAPRPFMYSPYWDEGVLARANLPFGSEEEHALVLAAYVINGFSAEGLDGFHKRNIGDNNENKTFGARAAATFRLGDSTTFTFGAATLIGKSDPDDEDAFHAIELDVDFTSGPFRVYAEAFYLASEFQAAVVENPDAVITEVSRLHGIKLRPEFRVADGWTLFVQADHLFVRQPQRMAGLLSLFDLGDEETAITTLTGGVRIDLTGRTRLRIEGGSFLRDEDLGPDIPYFSVSLMFSF